MAPCKKCLICGSRQWRKNAVGIITCSEGHVLQHYINESQEVDDIGTGAVRKRTLKSSRKEKATASKADPKLYHGERARFHYYQCLQLLFRKQIATLVTLWHLPPEFETICRDLWVFHLNLIPRPPPAEPFHYAREQGGYQCEPEEVGKRDRNSSSSEDEIFDPEIAVLLEENSEISSSDDRSSGDELCARNIMRTPTKRSRVDRLENTIAVLILACWTIRLPVIYMDFINAIESHSLPYFDLARTLPLSLTQHLAKYAVQALSPRCAPRASSLHCLVSRLANRAHETFDIIIPQLNTAPVLWRVVQECFCGTPMLYVLTKRVRNVLSLGLSLQGPISTRDKVPIEITLVATAIVVLKLVYGLDGKQRLPRSSDDVACVFPDVTEFLAAMKEADDAQNYVDMHRFGSRASLSVCDLDDASLDEYLEFCQNVLIDPKKDEHRILENYFPLGNGAADGMQDERPGLRERRFAPTKRNVEDMDVLEPGAIYRIYDTKDVLGNLPGDLATVIERSARWAGVDCESICRVVERYERRLVRWWNG